VKVEAGTSVSLLLFTRFFFFVFCNTQHFYAFVSGGY
jgi:hypothetical protein